MRARVVNVQRMSTEDGPGIRTTVFLKGCSLACAWCHNPESLAREPEVVWHDWKCIGCPGCTDVCERGALYVDAGRVRIDRSRCVGGTTCADACPTTALERIGGERDLDELIAEVRKDRAYFNASAGGVTLSGGEPGVQARFSTAFLRGCRAQGLHTALDTCGMCAPTTFVGMVREADLVLYDLKEIDSDRHRAFTGRGNERILANVVMLAEEMRRRGQPAALWIRTPIIPGCTADAANVQSIGAFIAAQLADVVARWELCAFNNLATDKYRRLDRPWHFAGIELLSDHEMHALETAARTSGVDPAIVAVTGRVRVGCATESLPDARR